jgi:hypothetical protein
MKGADDNRPITGSRQIKGKTEPPGDKPEKRRRKPNQRPDQKSASGADTSPGDVKVLPEAQEPEAQEPMDVTVASAERAASAGEVRAVATAELAASEPVSVTTITDAYSDYTRKSMQQTSSFIEHLLGTRSLSKALELQSEFALTAFETFVDETRKIRDLHRELAKQKLRGLEGFVMGRTPE